METNNYFNNNNDDPIIENEDSLNEIEIDKEEKRNVLRQIYGNPWMLVFCILCGLNIMRYIPNLAILSIVLAIFVFAGAVQIYGVKKNETKINLIGINKFRIVLLILFIISLIGLGVFVLGIFYSLVYLIGLSAGLMNSISSDYMVYLDNITAYLAIESIVNLPIAAGTVAICITGRKALKETYSNWKKQTFKYKKLKTTGIISVIFGGLSILSLITFSFLHNKMTFAVNRLMDYIYETGYLAEGSISLSTKTEFVSIIFSVIFFTFIGISFLVTAKKLRQAQTKYQD